MPIKRRRSLALVFVVLLSAVTGGAAGLAALAGDTERIDGYWVGAELTESGLRVTEVIDYDFGPRNRRGIFRDVPDLIPSSVSVWSPTAPSVTEVTAGTFRTRIRIGNPQITISGRHRYRIEYLLEPSSVQQDGFFSFNAIGTGWDIPINDVQISLAIPGGLTSPECVEGRWDEQACTITDLGDGRYRTEVREVAPGDGVTVSGRLGDTTGDVERFAPPSGLPNDPGTGYLLPAALAFIAALAGGLAATSLTRRAGRERVWTGGAADAAFGETADGLSSTRLDEEELAELATTEFEPPRNTSAAEGGLLLQERVRDEHRAAWLLESAIRGEIEIEGESSPVLRWGPNAAHPSVHQVLDAMFVGRRSITLNEYDEDFAIGWNRLGGELKDWLHGSPHWDEAGRKRQGLARLIAVLAVIAGGVLGALATLSAAREGGILIAGTVIGAAIIGAAFGTLLSSFELLVRTETGSALWLRIESFRRFLANSEARHVDEAAEKGLLRQYTAWAVALGESGAWAGAVADASRDDPGLATNLGTDLAFVHLGSSILRASNTATTKPASSDGDFGGGGGFSGSVGGGGGGGGGGSW